MEEELIHRIPEFISAVLRMSQPHLWVDYDSEVDVLYISFRKPQQATDSRLINDFILNYRGKEIVGITIKNASTYIENYNK